MKKLDEQAIKDKALANIKTVIADPSSSELMWVLYGIISIPSFCSPTAGIRANEMQSIQSNIAFINGYMASSPELPPGFSETIKTNMQTINNWLGILTPISPAGAMDKPLDQNYIDAFKAVHDSFLKAGKLGLGTSGVWTYALHFYFSLLTYWIGNPTRSPWIPYLLASIVGGQWQPNSPTLVGQINYLDTKSLSKDITPEIQTIKDIAKSKDFSDPNFMPTCKTIISALQPIK
jgi:hypothetical protein